jgi:hypothetical protein
MTIRGAMNRQSRPRSTRLEHHAWRDPRLILGVLLVLVSTVLGAAAVAAGSSSTGYWAVRSEVRAGDPVQRTDLVQAKAHVPDDAARHLMPVDDALPARLDDLVWARDIGDGALVSRASLADRRSGGVTELPLTVASGVQVPVTTPARSRSASCATFVSPPAGAPPLCGARRRARCSSTCPRPS